MKALFDNTSIAFSLKSDSDLRKTHRLFKLMAYPALVTVGTTLVKAALLMRLPITGMIKSFIYDQFCGGMDEASCESLVQQMHKQGVQAILDYSVEGKNTEADFEKAASKIVSLINYAHNHPCISFVAVKPTALGRFEVWEKLSAQKELTSRETKEWKAVNERFDVICEAASQCDIGVLIDAEESWMQDAADILCETLMEKYNQQNVIVYNTIQCYRHDRLAYLKALLRKAGIEGFKPGVKLVRGAYMEKENARAKKMKYQSPICKNKTETDNNFNEIMKLAFFRIKEIALFIGSHNEESTYLALELMKQSKIKPKDSSVWFSQLYGMSDHITFNLGNKGYNAVKLIPFGPLNQVLPYLFRRAQENTSVAGQTGRELKLLQSEIQRRKL